MASRLTSAQRWRQKFRERLIEGVLFLAAASSVLVTAGIVGVLLYESYTFFEHVPLKEFLTDTMWTPLFADPRFGILPLVTGTLLSTVVALFVAAPLGLIAAIYLSEFASSGFRETVKPTLELLSGVPTVVYGFFALLFVTPLLQKTILPSLPGFNILSAGIVIGIMIIPYVASVSEDALRAVPQSFARRLIGARRDQAGDRIKSCSAGCYLRRCGSTYSGYLAGRR